MKRLASALKSLWNDESGQGTAEYILVLVAVVMLAFLFKQQIHDIVVAKLGELSTSIGDFKSQ